VFSFLGFNNAITSVSENKNRIYLLCLAIGLGQEYFHQGWMPHAPLNSVVPIEAATATASGTGMAV